MADVELAIRMTADASDATAAADAVGDSFDRMAADVDDATRKADAAAGRLDNAADSVDNMGSASSQAAGGLGDLGGALALMPGPLGAMGAGMEAAAPAIMGVTGASDLMSLAMNSNIVQTTRATVASAAHRVAMIAQRAASLAAAAAQRVLNVAMRANPIGLLITALIVAVGFVVLLYKRSEMFRRIVNAVFAAAKKYVQTYIAVIMAVVGFFRDKLPAAAVWLRDRVVAVWQAIRDKAGAAWDWVRDKVAAVVEAVRGKLQGVVDKVVAVGDKVRSAIGGAFDWVIDKVETLLGFVQDVLDKLGSIDLPNLPGFGRTTVATTTTTAPGYGDSAETVTIVLPPISALDNRAMDQLTRELDAYYARRGQRIKLVPA